MTKGLQDFHFSNRSNREAIFLLLGIDSLQRNDFSTLFVGTNKDAPSEGERKSSKMIYISMDIE